MMIAFYIVTAIGWFIFGYSYCQARQIRWTIERIDRAEKGLEALHEANEAETVDEDTLTLLTVAYFGGNYTLWTEQHMDSFFKSLDMAKQDYKKGKKRKDGDLTNIFGDINSQLRNVKIRKS